MDGHGGRKESADAETLTSSLNWKEYVFFKNSIRKIDPVLASEYAVLRLATIGNERWHTWANANMERTMQFKAPNWEAGRQNVSVIEQSVECHSTELTTNVSLCQY